MKHSSGDIVRVNHILDAIENIELILHNVTIEDFKNNLEKSLSVERLLEIIGEATKNISEDVLYDKENSTPWILIMGLRNVISHEYFRVDHNTIYQLATVDIIPLKKEILRIKDKLEK